MCGPGGSKLMPSSIECLPCGLIFDEQNCAPHSLITERFYSFPRPDNDEQNMHIVEMKVVSALIFIILKNSQSAGTFRFQHCFRNSQLILLPTINCVAQNLNFAAAGPNSVSDILK